jgi:hypothetical protein
MIIIKQVMEFAAILSIVPAAVSQVVVKRKIPNIPVRFLARRRTYQPLYVIYATEIRNTKQVSRPVQIHHLPKLLEP